MPSLVDWPRIASLILKKQFIRLGSGRRLASVDHGLVAETLPRRPITFFYSVRDLGIILNQQLRFSSHMNQLTRLCNHQFCQLQGYALSIPVPWCSCIHLVHAFVTSQLDRCCWVLVGLYPLRCWLALKEFSALLPVSLDNGHTLKHALASDFLQDTLHLLPVSQRINYRNTAPGLALLWPL